MEDSSFYTEVFTQISFRASKSKLRKRDPLDLKISKLVIKDDAFKQRLKLFIEQKVMDVVNSVLPEGKASGFKKKTIWKIYIKNWIYYEQRRCETRKLLE